MSELEWDSEIQADTGNTLLSVGVADFKIVNMKRDRYNGGAKISACPMVKLEVQLSNDEGRTKIESTLFLHSDVEWKLSEFFRAIGLKKHGEKIRMDWTAVVGAVGKCEVGIREYVDKNTAEKKQINEIKKWLDFDGVVPAKTVTQTPVTFTDPKAGSGAVNRTDASSGIVHTTATIDDVDIWA